MTQRKTAQATIGPWTGLRVYDEDQNVVVFIDPSAKSDLIDLAVQSLQADAIVWSKNGHEYKLQAGVPFALQILKAIQ